MFKTDIINRLGAKHGFTSYLEICTPTTGARYAEVDRSQFTACTKIMYRWRSEFADGLSVDYPIVGEAIEGVVEDLRHRGFLYDLILVDPWHSYESSLKDMRLGLSLLKEGGVLVVHDCSPPSLDVAGPSFIEGSWCGMTYAALIDFVAGEPGLEIYTVDTDYGCAVLRRRAPAEAIRGASRPDPKALKGWNATGPNFKDRYRFFDAHRVELLNLISAREFLGREGLSPLKSRGSLWQRIRNRCS